MTILVSGYGSIGQKYVELLKEAGHDVKIYDPKLGLPENSFEEAVKKYEPDKVIIATPPNLHLKQAKIAVDNGCHVLIEKPLAIDYDELMDDGEEIEQIAEEKNLFVTVVHNMRFVPGLQKLKNDYIHRIGKIKYISAYATSYLPDWRPDQDWTKSVSANPKYGGAIFDFIHEFDYMNWLMVENMDIINIYGMQRFEQIDVESAFVASMILQFDTLAQLYGSFDEKHQMRKCSVIGEKGMATWDYYAKTTTMFNETEAEEYNYEFERDDMYRAMLSDFIMKCREPEKRDKFWFDIKLIQDILLEKEEE